MWKVKRMSRARHFVLTLAPGAGGIVGGLAGGSDKNLVRTDAGAGLAATRSQFASFNSDALPRQPVITAAVICRSERTPS
jgi:hypothetical protein